MLNTTETLAPAKYATFTRATDSRGRTLDGIWVRGGLFYAQINVPGKGCRRLPLLDEHKRRVGTVAQASAAYARMMVARQRGEYQGPRITPPFDEYVDHYLQWMTSTEAKSPLTIKKERYALNGWKAFLGSLRLNLITRQTVNSYVLHRVEKDGVSNRAANLDVLTLQNLLNFARSEKLVQGALVTEDWKALSYKPARRPLRTHEEIERICAEATRTENGKPVRENGQFLADYVRLLAYSGARRQAGLSAKWEQVDWGNRQLTLFTKFDKRVVDFNEELEAHLKDMESRRDKNSPWIFPTPRHTKGPGYLANPQKVLNEVTTAIGFPDFHLHDLRHYFISHSVMSGVDTLTVAAWVGHSDGGVLIGKTYGHLIAQLQPRHILFCGDTDTATNYQFAVGAVRLANLVKPTPVLLPRLPMDAPGKGVDDCREVLGSEFDQWWRGRVASAVPVVAETTAACLMITLFEAVADSLVALKGTARLDLEERVVKLAAALTKHSTLQERVLGFATKELGMGRRGLLRAVGEVEKQLSSRQQRAEGKGREIEHDQPSGVWTRQVWEAVTDLLYQYAGQVCRFHEGRLHAQSAAEMVPFLDHPDRCRFMTRNRNAEAIASSFTEADARAFLGDWMNVPDLIRTVDVFSNVPVLAWDGQQAVLVNRYDRALRILANGETITLPSPQESVALLAQLLCDYDFATAGDLGRAIALLLSLALAQGGFLGKGRVPLFLIEKNEASAGGSLLLRLACQIYGLKPQPISRLDNHDKAIEDISRLLLSGAGFLYFDNARGKGLQNLPELESLLTEPIFNCRAPYKHGEADVTRRVLAVSSNGAVFSHDLATRTAKIAIRKRPDNYIWASYPEGNIEDHVVANMGRYLGAVFSLVKDWADQGRPAGAHLTGFRFPQWERACAWILQKHFPGLPLLDASHQDAQERLADPDHDLIRNLFRLVVEGETRGELTASSLAEIGAEVGLLEGDEQQNRMKIGKVMKRRFNTDGEHTFDGGNFRVKRDTRLSNSGNGHEVAFYEIHAGGRN